jgi:hypothetical protein
MVIQFTRLCPAIRVDIQTVERLFENYGVQAWQGHC